MKIMAKLALRQLINRPRQTAQMLFSIVLSVAILIAISNFGSGGTAVINDVFTEFHQNQGQGYDASSIIVVILSIVLAAVVFVASAVIISTSFSTAAGEQLTQFGIIKSIGATGRQIAVSIIFMSIYLSAVGIPLGFAFGMLINLAVIVAVSTIIGTGPIHLSFAFSPLLSVVAIALIFGVVLLSAWLPSRKIARISAIDAIRGAGEIVIKNKGYGKSRIAMTIFGIEGVLTTKQIKRNRRHFRATTVSICVSIVLILLAGSLRTHLAFSLEGRGAQLGLSADNGIYGVGILFITGEPADSDINSAVAQTILEELRAFPNTEVVWRGTSQFSTLGPNVSMFEHMMDDFVTLTMLDSDRQRILAEHANAGADAVIHINVALEIDQDLNFTQTNPFNDTTGESYVLYKTMMIPDDAAFMGLRIEIDDAPMEITIDTQLTTLPSGFYELAEIPGMIVVPDLIATTHHWISHTDNPAEFVMHADAVLARHIALGRTESLSIVNSTEETALLMAYFGFLSAFVLVFSIMLIALALVNIISAIMGSVQVRRREFAILVSVGMDKKGITRMLSLEGTLRSISALLIGLPIGFAVAWLAYWFVQMFIVGLHFAFPFVVPWLEVAISTIGVFVAITATTRVAASSIVCSNVIDVVRSN